MAENDQNELDITDDEAEQLLADDAGAEKPAPPRREPADADQLGDAGKRALNRMKAEKQEAERAARDLQARLKKYEDEGKSESQRLQEERDTHLSRAEKAEAALKRREIAEERAPEHATIAQIKAVAKRLAGDTDEALEADADELFELLAPAPAAAKTTSRPKERLKGGSEPDEPVDETDPIKLAAAIPRRR